MSSLTIELEINNLLLSSNNNYLKREENEMSEQTSKNELEQAYKLIQKNTRESLIQLSSETIAKFCELSLKIKQEYCEELIDQFLIQNKSQGQMYIRGLIIKGKLIAKQGHEKQLKGEQMIENIKKGLKYIQQAVEGAATNENKLKYSFLIYNISVALYEIIRPMFRPMWQQHFQELLEKIDKLFEEIDEVDFNWRCKLTLTLFQCLYDSGKQADSFKVLDKLWDLTKKKQECDFQDNLLRIRIHYGKENGGLLTNAKKDADSAAGDKYWKQLSILQQIKSGIIGEALVEKELIGVINSMNSSILGDSNNQSSVKINQILQERIAESGRVALNANLISIAESVCSFLSRISQLSQKALVLQEYTKAELLIKKPPNLIDSLTQMRFSQKQQRDLEINRRLEALRILEKTMSINKKLQDAELIYEGSILIWNLSLPFLNQTHKAKVIKPLHSIASLLEMIECNDHQLRVNLHLELAKSDFNDDSISKADTHIKKAMKLDPSIPILKVKDKLNEEEDLSLYQRPNERYLTLLKDKIKIQLNTYQEPESNDSIEKVILDLQQVNLPSTQSNQKKELLIKCYNSIITMEAEKTVYQEDVSRNLVEEEIKKERLLFKQKMVYLSKVRRLLACEIAKISFHLDLELSSKASQFVVDTQWEIKNAVEVILAQVEAYYTLSKIYMQLIFQNDFEKGFNDCLKIDEDQEDATIPQELKRKIQQYKSKIIECLINGLKLADSINQSWLVFDGAIIVWNSYLNVFCDKSNDSKLFPDIFKLLKEFFEVMRNQTQKMEKQKIKDYELENKIQVFANIGLIYGRLCEGKSQFDEVIRVAEALLQAPLNLQSRKLVNQLKARNQAQAKVPGGAVGQGKGKENKKQNEETDNSQVVIFEVVQQLEIIENNQKGASNQELIKKCYSLLETWKSKDNDETELELYSELWTRLSRLALNENNMLMNKYSLKALENSLSKVPEDLQKVPLNRLRWYSLAEYLYSETLLKIMQNNNQQQSQQQSQQQQQQQAENESQTKLLFYALQHATESALKADRARIKDLVIDAAKQIWNICVRLRNSPVNRQQLIKPLCSVLIYLKNNKVRSEPDLVLLLSQLLFESVNENQLYAQGEQLADIVFQILPKSLQKPIWEAKLTFMSKQGKNELQAISNMKESDASLQAKIWLKLARNASNVYKQYQAYSKAIEILRKENNVEIVEILIEFSEWLLRNAYDLRIVKDNLLLASDRLLEIEMDDYEEQDDNNKTIFSRSSRGKMTNKSINSSSVLSRKSDFNSKKMSKNITINKSKSKLSNNNNKSKKNIKSKSLFSQKQEDPEPEQLKCHHYERLFRIHAMLAMVSSSMESKLENALESKYFIQKMFKQSFNTLLNLELNEDKYKNYQSVQDSLKLPINKYRMPVNVEDWVNLQFSTEFLEKVRTMEDYSFMSVFIFEKPELTYEYANQVVSIFEQVGLYSHIVVFLIFMKFIAKEILQSNLLTLLVDLKYSRILSQINFNQHSNKIFKESNISTFKIKDKQFLLSQTRNQKIHHAKNTSITFNNNINNINSSQQQEQPYLIKQFQNYKLWIEISKELVYIGQLSQAEELLQESIKHCQLLEDEHSIGIIYLYQGIIYMQEGKLVQSKEKFMECHRRIKNIQEWELLLIELSKVLNKMKSKLEMQEIIKRISDVLKAMIVPEQTTEVYDQTVLLREKQQGNKLSIELLISTISLVRLYYEVKNNLSGMNYSFFESSLSSLSSVLTQLNSIGSTLTHSQFILKIINLFLKTLHQFEMCNEIKVKFAFKIYDKIHKLLINHHTLLDHIFKYLLILDKTEMQFIHTPLHRIQQINTFYQSICIIEQGICKQIIRSKIIKLEQSDENTLNITHSEQQQYQQQKLNEEEKSKEKVDEKLQIYLNQLDYEIQQKLMPIPYRLESFERAVALLTSQESRLHKSSPLLFLIKVELMRSKRLLAETKYPNQQSFLWKHQEYQSIQSNSYNQQVSSENKIFLDSQQQLPLQQSQQQEQQSQLKNDLEINYRSEQIFKLIKMLEEQNIEEQLREQYGLKQSLLTIYKLYIEALESVGNQKIRFSFNCLVKAQHMKAVYEQLLTMRQFSCQDEKFKILEKRMKKNIKNNTSNINMIKDLKIYTNMVDVPNNVLVNQLLPQNSSYLSIHLSTDRRFIYVGFLRILLQDQRDYILVKEQLNEQQYNELLGIIKSINEIKNALIKSAILTEQDLRELERVQESNYVQVLNRLEMFCQFFTAKVDSLINEKISMSEDQLKQQQQNQQQSKEVKGKDVKKDPKNQQSQQQQEQISGSNSGIVSICVILDSQLEAIPFEHLNVFRDISAKSRDFSFYQLAKKYQDSLNLNINNIKYVANEFKTEDDNFDKLIKKMSIKNLKINGVSSGERIASIGEYQKYMEEAQGLIYYSNQPFLEMVNAQMLISMIEKNNVQMFLIVDKLNHLKTSLNKKTVTDQNSNNPIKIATQYQTLNTLQILSLFNPKQILATRWSVDIQETNSQIFNFLSNLDSNHPFSATLTSHHLNNPNQLLIYKHNLLYFGIPL